MKIISFEFEHKTENWKIEKIHFNPKITLLVGASGVGKTQILRGLKILRNIAGYDPEVKDMVKWCIEFETNDNKKYTWKGETDNSNKNDFFEKNRIEIIAEEIILNGKNIAERNNGNIIFEGQKMPKLSASESLIYLFREGIGIMGLFFNFLRMFFFDYKSLSLEPQSILFHKQNFYDVQSEIKNYNSLDQIKNNFLLVLDKLFLIQEKDQKTFNIIKQQFIDIFPKVEDLRCKVLIKEDNKEYISIQIKEQGVTNWIDQKNISSGMFRTLMQLSELYLCADGSVFLMDEFENSLGINCIDEITRNIISSNRNLQFIITSHHPYIINNIPHEYWKLVTRTGNAIKTHNIDEFLTIKNSKHDAFMQLIQLDEYITGEA